MASHTLEAVFSVFDGAVLETVTVSLPTAQF